VVTRAASYLDSQAGSRPSEQLSPVLPTLPPRLPCWPGRRMPSPRPCRRPPWPSAVPGGGSR